MRLSLWLAGAWEDLETPGRKRLLPTLGQIAINDLDETIVRAWLGRMVEAVKSGVVAAKTINNARAALSAALTDAARRDLIERNPCEYVAPLPIDRTAVAFLRLNEIERYLNACPDHYQPLASVLIGTGARISEALALRWSDVDLDHGIIRIERQRARNGDHTTVPKGKRARSVLIGPRLIDALTHQRSRIDTINHGAGWLFVCPRPTRGRYSRRDVPAPPSRKTVHEWHEHALRTAGLPDMPLHALRHTAAAAWLSTGHSLVFAARQLGHRSITKTEHYYGHLELNLFTNALKATDAAIANAGREVDGEP